MMSSAEQDGQSPYLFSEFLLKYSLFILAFSLKITTAQSNNVESTENQTGEKNAALILHPEEPLLTYFLYSNCKL